MGCGLGCACRPVFMLLLLLRALRKAPHSPHLLQSGIRAARHETESRGRWASMGQTTQGLNDGERVTELRNIRTGP